MNISSLFVFLKHTDHILDVESLSVVIVKSLEVSVLKLPAIEPCSTKFVNNMSILINQPSMLVDSSTLLVNEEALFSLQESWNGQLRFVVKVKVQVTLQIMGVKVVLFNTERCRELTSIIQVINAEVNVMPARETFNDVTCSWVDQITAVVGWSALPVNFIASFVLNHNDIAFVVTLPISEHIVHIEISLVCVRNTDEISFFRFEGFQVLVVAEFNSGIFLF